MGDPSRVLYHFGTDRPTPGRFEEVLAQSHAAMGQADPDEWVIGECRMRWTGVYVVPHTGDEPTHLGIFGYSGD